MKEEVHGVGRVGVAIPERVVKKGLHREDTWTSASMKGDWEPHPSLREEHFRHENGVSF